MSIGLAALILILSVYLPGAAAAVSSPDVVAKRRAMMSEKPYSFTVPRSNEPVGQIIVLRIWPDQVDLRFALAALQGIVNRDQPKLYIGFDKTLSWLEYHSAKIWVKGERDPYRIFDMYKDRVKGLVVYDPKFDASSNVAITYAGIEDLLPVTPELAEAFSSKYGWKVVHDLRGKWTNRLDAYKWSYENLFPKCTKFALMHFNHGFRVDVPEFDLEGPGHHIAQSVDYAVASRMFVWHIGNKPLPGELEFAGKVMESVPFYTPVVGGSSGADMFDEPALVCFVASYANLHIPFYACNVTVLSGVRIPDRMLRQRRHPMRDLGPDKIYVTFTNSEHDNMGHVIGGGPPWERLGFETDDPYRIWWCDPWRGRVPIGWPIGPLLSELAPTTLAQLVTTATENDYFMAALTGICLTSLPDFASAYPQDQEDLAAGYAKLTGSYMKRLGWTMVNPWAPPGNLRTFAKNIPGLEGLFEGYGMRGGMTYEKANYMLDGVPVFHALTNGVPGGGREVSIANEYGRRSKTLANWIKDVKVTERPGFIHAWTIGWDLGPTTLKMSADMLPSEYVVVRPDEFVALFKKYKGGKAELKSTGPKVKPSGVVTETANGDTGLIVDTGKIKVEIGWGEKAQAPIRRVMGVDGKWRCGGTLLTHNPWGRSVTSFTCQRTKSSDAEKEYLLSYSYDDGGSIRLKARAIAGRPYVLFEEEINQGDIPSWSLDLYPDFQPDTLYTDTKTHAITYAGVEVYGGPPFYGWILGGNRNCRDLIGLYTCSWLDWDSGDCTLWRREKSAYLEFYHQRKGFKKFAVAALDRNDKEAPTRLWKELNGSPERHYKSNSLTPTANVKPLKLNPASLLK
ncbi:MAG: GxGYxYP family putative glycoside hydrolase [Armatimonadota bacterium]|nr:GxGYxYP family putative glycoside hydrolase [Armatimonadota bacterium]